MVQYSIDIAAVSDKGNVKKINEDSIIARVGEYRGEEFGLFVVCDGLGGLSCGDVASKIAINEFEIWWKEKLSIFIKSQDDNKIISSFKEVVNICNWKIMKHGKDINKKIGTTLSVLFLLRGKYYVVHIGDSRVYRIGSKLEQITEDHSYVAMRVRNGEMTPSEAKKSINRNLLLQCVGVKDTLDIYCNVGRFNYNESFILCSDGFYNSFEDEELLKMFNMKKKKRYNLQNYLLEIVQVVKDRKERDNISIILVKLKKKHRSTILKMFSR